MIDEMQQTIDAQSEQLLQKDLAIEEMKKRMEEMEKLLESRGI